MWLSMPLAHKLLNTDELPLFVYSKANLQDRATELMNLQLPFGHTARYAMKANPHPQIIALFHAAGLQFDASSSYEASELLAQGIPGHHISLSSQQPAHNLAELLRAGVQFVATSVHQLELFAAAAQAGDSVALRVNTGSGSGHSKRTTTGGVASSFGLWHEYVPQALAFATQHELRITRLHVHIGSGADPARWGKTMDEALAVVAQMPDVTTLDIGGGYKVKRAAGEAETDMRQVAAVFADKLTAFAATHGRELHLEIEPGTWLVAHAGVLLSRIVDIVDTGAGGYNFIKLNTGMNDILRPAMYGAQHDIQVLNDTKTTTPYVVVGHNCETGDILTPAPGNPEEIQPRPLRTAAIGDVVAIADVGAYCASWSPKGYNSFPDAGVIFV